MNAFTEHAAVRLPGHAEAEAPCPHLRALKGSISHDGPALTVGQIDLLIEATVMEEFMTSMGWDPTAVVNAADWPALESMPDLGDPSEPLFGCLAQTFRDQQVEFYVPDTAFFGHAETGNRKGGTNDRA
jgi:hypothetical protein